VAALCHVKTILPTLSIISEFFYSDHYRLTYLFLLTAIRVPNITVEVSGRPRPALKPDVRLPGVVLGLMLIHSSSRIYKSLPNEPKVAVFSCRTRETRFLHHEGTFSRKFPITLVSSRKQIIHTNVTIVCDVTTYSLVILHRFLPRVFFLYFEDGSSFKTLLNMTSHPSRQSS